MAKPSPLGTLTALPSAENVLTYYRRQLAKFVWAQMEQHLWETPTDYVPRITRGFSLLRPMAFSLPAGQAPRPFRQIASMAFDVPWAIDP